MSDLILHCGAQAVDRQALDRVPIPRTRSHRPIPYGDSVDFVISEIRKQLGMEPAKAQYGLQKDGAQMFAKFQYDVGDSKSALSVGLSNSYNKSRKCMFGGGGVMLVCDNLSFSADGFVYVRRNTTFAWQDFKGVVVERISLLLDQYKSTMENAAQLEAKPCNERRGYAMLGVALGEQVLTPTQANVAFREWREPSHEEFADRNFWSLYNATTEGLKKGAVSNVVDRHCRAHEFYMEMADKYPANGVVIDVQATSV